MRAATGPEAGRAGLESGQLSPEAARWWQQFADVGLPQRYILRLHVFVRLAAGGVRFAQVAEEARRAVLRFDVVRGFNGQLAAKAGDRLDVDPLHPTRPIVVWRSTAEGWREVEVLPPSFNLLPALERDGCIAYSRCLRPAPAGASS